MSEPLTHQFDDLFDNDNSFNMGVRAAVTAMKTFLDAEISVDSKDGYFPEEWLGHIVAMDGLCDCAIDKVYDENTYDIRLCVDYNDLYFRRQWYIKWHNMTEEELLAKLHAEAEEKQRKEAERIESDRQRRLEKLHELAKEFGVDPQLLP